MKKGIHKIIAVVVALAIAAGLTVVAALYPDAKLVFRGVSFSEASDGSVQTFVDIYLQDVEAHGIDFTLSYDRSYVELSDALTNEPLYSDSLDDMYGVPYFQQNTDLFPEGSLMTMGFVDADAEDMLDGMANCAIYVNPGAANDSDSEEEESGEGSEEEPEFDYGDYIKDIEVESGIKRVINANTSEGLKIGSLSFRVKDPAKFAKLSDDEINEIFGIVNDGSGDFSYIISFIDPSVSDDPQQMYDEMEHIEYEFALENTVYAVRPLNDDVTVSAAEVYIDGSENDLITYLNTHMSNIEILYTRDAQVLDNIVWGNTEMDFDVSEDWDPKGGVSYVVSQRYNDDLTVHAKLTVTPVTVVGYSTDNDYEVYADMPTDMSDLNLPTTAKPLFDVVVPGYTNLIVPVLASSWNPSTLPADLTAPTDFTAKADVSALPQWATVDTDEVTVTRMVGERTSEPAASAVVDDNGVMTITVDSVGAASPLDANTVFDLKMPSGEIIDRALYDVELNSPTNGKATITMPKAGVESEQLARLKQYINMGSRLGDFSIAATEPTKGRSEWAAFTATERNNYYLDDYVADYTGQRKTLFPFTIGSTPPPTTITLPEGDAVSTTYSGVNGSEPGALSTVTVYDWTLKTGDPSKMNEVVVYEGILKDNAAYGAYGTVKNPANPTQKKITLRLVVSAEDIEESISPLTDFVFDTKKEGYTSDQIETKEFEIQNMGACDIYGLHVMISSSDFELKTDLPYLLQQTDKASFEIRPQSGLPAGTYTAVVTIGSNKTSVLGQFNISFTVTDEDVYSVKVTPNDSDWGTASVVGSSTYAKGQTVTLKAEAEAGCAFKEWTVNGGITLDDFDPSEPNATFKMPESDVELTAVFEAGPITKLKLSALRVFDKNNSQQTLKDPSTNLDVTFDSKKQSYNVYLPYNMDGGKIEFELLNTTVEGNAVTTAVSHSVQGALTTTYANPVYATDPVFDVYKQPDTNVITITLTAGEYTTDYTVTIYRLLSNKEKAEFVPGNSPYGLIQGDNTTFADQAAKDAAKQKFDENGNKYAAGFVPQNGKADIRYEPYAWGKGEEGTDYTNYDKDDNAIFVYSGSTFKIPGIGNLKNSLGEEITDLTQVTVSITVKAFNEATTATTLAGKFGDVVAGGVSGIACSADGSAVISGMAGTRVRPGVYNVEYSYNDFDGSKTTVTRPIIFLSASGDVDASGSVNGDDGKLIRGRYKNRMPYDFVTDYTSGGRVYKYRVCDANADGEVNAADARTIDAGAAKAYYVPLPEA